MSILATILIGFIVGALARFLMPGRDPMGFIFTTLLGIAGALVAQFLGRSFGWYAPEEPAGFLAALIGAVLVLAVARQFRRPLHR